MEEAKLVLKVVLDEAVKELQRMKDVLVQVNEAGKEAGQGIRDSMTGATMMDEWTKKIIEETSAVKKLVNAELELNKIRQRQKQEYDAQLKLVRQLQKEFNKLVEEEKKTGIAPEAKVAKERELNQAKELLSTMKTLHKVQRQQATENVANVKKSIAEQIKYSGVIGQQIKLVEELRVKWRYATSQADLKKYGQQLQDAEKKLAQLKATGEGAFSGINRGATIATSITRSLRGMLVRFVSIYAILGTIKEIVKTITEFEQGMKELEAITNATGEEMLRLEKQSISLAGAYRFNAKAISELYLQLARLGFTTDEIEKSTKALLRLSTATGEDLASSAQIAASVIRGLQLDAENLTHIVDVMGVGFNTSALDLARFRESIKYVLPISKELGLSFELLTALLGKLADAQIYGSLAGTSLRNLFSELADPTSKLTELIGFMVRSDEDLIKALDILNEKGLALGDIFNLVEKRATTTLTVLINNADGMKSYYEQMLAANGEMQRMADKVMESLQSQMIATKNEWQAMILSMDKGQGVISKVGKFFATEFRDLLRDMNRNITTAEILTDVYDKFNRELDTGSQRLELLKKRYVELKKEVEVNIRANDELRFVIDEIVKLLPQAATGYDMWGKALDVSLPKIDAATAANKEFMDSLADFSTDKILEEIAKTIYSIGDYNEQVNELIKEQNRLEKVMRKMKIDPRGTSEEAKQVRLLKQEIIDLNARTAFAQNNLQIYINNLQQMGVAVEDIGDMLKDLDFAEVLSENMINNKIIRPYQNVLEKFNKFVRDIFAPAIQLNFELKEEKEFEYKLKQQFNDIKDNLITMGMSADEALVEAYNQMIKTYTERLDGFKKETDKAQWEYMSAVMGMSQIGDTWDVVQKKLARDRAKRTEDQAKTALEQISKYVSDTFGNIQIMSDELLKKEESIKKRLINVRYEIWQSENNLSRDSLKKRENTLRIGILKEIELLKLEQEYLKKTKPDLSAEEYDSYTRLINQKYKELTIRLADVKVEWYSEQEKLDRDYHILELKNQVQTFNSQKKLAELAYEQQLSDLDKYYETRSKSDGSYDKERLNLTLQFQKTIEDLTREHQSKMYQAEKNHQLSMMQLPSGYFQDQIDALTLAYETNSEILYRQLENQEIAQEEYFNGITSLYRDYYDDINLLKQQQSKAAEDSLEKDLEMLQIRQDMELESLKARLETGAIIQEQYDKDYRNIIDKGYAEEWKIRESWANKMLDISTRVNENERQIRDNRIKELRLSNEAEAKLLKESEMQAIKTALDNALVFAETQKLIYGESSDEYKKAIEQIKLLRSQLSLVISEYESMPGGNLLDVFGLDKDGQEALIQAWGFIKDEFTSFLSDIYDRQVEYADRQVELYDQMIEEKQREVETEAELMAEGYANMKSIREAELADLRVKREEAYKIQQQALKRQEALEKTIQAVNMVTAITEVIKGAAKEAAITMQPWLAPVIAAGVTAALFGILRQFSSQAKSIQYGEGGSYVIEGKRHTQGGEVIREGEQGEMVSVFSRKATAKYGDFIQSLTQSLNQDHPQEIIPALAKSNFVGDRLEFPVKTNIEKFKEITQRREEVKRLDVKVSLDESSELRNIRKLLDTRLDEQYIETVEYIIYKKGNLTRRIRK